MGRHQETFNKKEVRNKKEKKRKEKEKKRQARKESDKNSFDDMIAYVDEFGMITSTPPDPENRKEVEIDDIEISVGKKEMSESDDPIRKGIVSFYNDSKGFGFIRDKETQQSIFVHAKNLLEPIKENNIVTFEIGNGPKGLIALEVKQCKE